MNLIIFIVKVADMVVALANVGRFCQGPFGHGYAPQIV